MIAMLNYSGSKRELALLKKSVKDLAAYLSEDRWEIKSFGLLQEVESFLKEQPVLNLSCYDITKKESLDYLHFIRTMYQEMKLMLIADWKMSPMEYIKPDILASELILRPYREEDLRNKLRGLIEFYLNKESEQDVFILETKEEKMRIPYSQIYYVEARDKKLFMRLKKSGFGFYGTLDALEKELPSHFIRCHRGFVVNWKFVERVLRSQNQLVLADEIQVPFSRSYKARVMELSQ